MNKTKQELAVKGVDMSYQGLIAADDMWDLFPYGYSEKKLLRATVFDAVVVRQHIIDRFIK